MFCMHIFILFYIFLFLFIQILTSNKSLNNNRKYLLEKKFTKFRNRLDLIGCKMGEKLLFQKKEKFNSLIINKKFTKFVTLLTVSVKLCSMK